MLAKIEKEAKSYGNFYSCPSMIKRKNKKT